jgi:hypothetical protein
VKSATEPGMPAVARSSHRRDSVEPKSSVSDDLEGSFRQRIEEKTMAAESGRGGSTGGIGLGGILVIIGIVLMIVWSFWIGLIVTLVGLIAFGGFARGKWY